MGIILILLAVLGGAIFSRILLKIFSESSNKVRAVVSFALAVGMGVWAWSSYNKLENGDYNDMNVLFAMCMVPLMLGIGMSFIFVSVNYESGSNWYEYFSIGNTSFGQDISIPIIFMMLAVIVFSTVIGLVIYAFVRIPLFVIYGIIQIFVFLRVFFSEE